MVFNLIAKITTPNKNEFNKDNAKNELKEQQNNNKTPNCCLVRCYEDKKK